MVFYTPLKKCELKKCGLCNKPCKRPLCKPLCPCIKKIEEVKEDLHTLEGKVDRNAQKIKNNYNELNNAISDLAEKHARDHNYVINYIYLKDAENDYLLQLEINRAKAAETNITNNLSQEILNRIDGDNILLQNINNLSDKHDRDIQDMNNHLDDILGIDAQGVSEIKAILSDDDTTTGLITELATKATKVALQNEIDRSTGKDNSHDTAILNLQNDKANKSSMTAGTYRSVTVNSEGIVTAGTNPTTLGGYGITDAKIENGVITLGSNTITPLTQHLDISGKANSTDVYTKTQVDDIVNALSLRISILEGYWTLNANTNRLETSYVIEPEGYR